MKSLSCQSAKNN